MAVEVGIWGWLAGGMFHSDHEVDPVYWAVGLVPLLVRLLKAKEEEEEELVEEELVFDDLEEDPEDDSVEVVERQRNERLLESK